MILQSMTPEEKVRQMQHLKPYVYDYAMAWATRNYNIIRRTKVFPTMYTFDREVQGMGTWTMVATAESKANIRKNIIHERIPEIPCTTRQGQKEYRNRHIPL